MANQIIARGDQPSQPGTGWTENASGLGRFATAAGATIASGFIPTAGGGRMWDKYINTIRGVETGFPAAILRTFRTSEFLSPLESWKEIDVNAPHLKGGKYAEFLKNSFGPVEGLSMKRTGHVFGEVTDQLGKTVGYGLQIEAGTSKGASIADYYARVTGTPLTQHASLNDALLRTMYKEANVPISFERWKQSMEPHLRRQRLILGAKLRSKLSVMGKDIKLTSEMSKNVAKLETTGQLLRAKAASTAGRLNILLKAPLDFPVIKEVFSKIPGLRSMAVKPGTNIDFMRRFAWKGAMAGAAWKGLEYVDYLRSESSPWAAILGTAGGAGLGGLLARKSGTKFSKAGMLAGAAFGLFSSVAPRFEEGLFHGLVSVATDAKVTQAELSEKMGFAESLRRQEEISPGMTNPTTGLAFGLIAGLGTGLYSYGSFMKEAISKKAPGQPIYQVMESLRETRSTEFAEKVWGSKLGKKIKRMPGLKALAKIKSPMALGFTAGFAAWQGISSATAIMSGNLLAAIPGASLFATSDDPQELRDIYSGRKEVAIRKGRWWEFGRCLLQDTEIITEFGSYTDAKNIKVDDVVLSSTGRLSKVKHVWEREYEGLAYYIYTSLDENLSTGMTGNHKVPVLVKDKKNFSLCEKEASKINVGEYVRVPIPELSEDLLELKTKEFIKVGRYLIYNNTILPAQINWHNKKIQQSHGASLKENIELNSNIGRLFGYFLAEGNLSYNQDNLPCMIETVHAKSERWIVDDILLICEKELTITPTVRFKKGKKKTDEGCWIVRICSSLLARVFYELFYNSDKNQDKIFPKEFLSTSVLFKEHLTEAYWRGDGHSEKNAKIISSCRKDFLVKIQAILFSLGYYPTIGRFESNDYRGRYRLRWDKDKRYRGRGFKGSFIWNEDSLYVKVEQIRIKEYFGLVYDFEVSDPDHLFVAGTFLVHNSSGYEGGRIEYYRPHFLHRLRTRAFQKGIYGDESEKWDYDPMLHPLKALFGSDDWKYHYEKKHQYDRPAPLCLHPETPVLTKKGYLPIREVSIGDQVYNSDGEWTSVTNTTSRDCYEKQLIKIRIAGDNRFIKMTPDHKVLVVKNKSTNQSNRCRNKKAIINNSTPEWISAKDILKNDLVLIPLPKIKENYMDTLDLKDFVPYVASGDKVFLGDKINQDIADAYMSGFPVSFAAKKFNVSHKRLYQLTQRRPKTIGRYLEIDEDFAYLLGWYLAEGWIGNRQGPHRLPSNVSFALCSDEQYVIDFLSDYSKRKFNATVSVYFSSENGIQARINSTVFATFLEHLFKQEKATNKTIPNFVFGWPKELKQQFVKGLIRGDGHYKKSSKKSKGEITFVSASSALTASLRLLLISIGIKSSFREQLPNPEWKEAIIKERIIPKNKSYLLSISGPDYDIFAEFEEKITKIDSLVSQKGVLNDYAMFVPIRAINIIPYEGKVYDITVVSKSCFLTTCIVHNSGTYGEDVPFVGPLIAATFGKLFKPRKMVRPEEWNLGDGEYVHQPDPRGETEPVYDLGGLKPGAPVLPEEGSQLLNELNYRRREAVGLVGFAEGAITKSILGREEFLENKQTFGTMGKETGSEYWWWSHLNLGGGAGTCFVSGTPVKTSSGMKPIEQISKGDLVLGIDGYCPVVNILEKKPTEQFHEIEVKESGTKIICTKNHWIPILRRERYKKGHLKPFKDNNYKIIEVQAIDIKEEDYLFYPIDEHISREKIDLSNPNKAVTSKYVYHQASNDFAVAYEMLEKNSLLSRKRLRESGIPDLIAKEVLRQFRLGQTPKRANRFIKIDKDIAFAIGWYIAEGSSDKGKITYTMHANELNYARMIKETFKQLGYHGKIRIKNNTLRLNIYSSLFAQYFKVFGKNSHEKCIPKRFQSLEQDMLYSLVSGLMLGDGWGELDPNKGPGGFTSVSKQLTKDLFHCLLRLGIQSYLTTDYLEISQGMMPQGTPRKDHIRNYLKIKKGRQNWKFFENTYLVRVTKSKSIARDDIVVYDLTVKDLHYYTADGVLVHNTEAIRRFIPRTRSYLDRYNPIKNQLPSWLPDDYFLDLKHGNPFEKIKEAEIRLPGPGYESLYPELEGLSPEEYPLAHRVKILGDVAMYSKKYRDTLTVAKSQLQNMSEKEAWLIKQTDRQVKEKKKRKNFQPYVFNEKLLKQESVNVTEVLSPRRFKTKEYGDLMLEIQGIGAITHPDAALEMMKNTIEGKEIDIYTPSMDDRRYGKVVAGSRMKVVPMIGGKDLGAILAEERITEEGALEDEFKQIRFSPMERLAGSFSEKMLHNLETPIEYLTPLSPASKLVRQRSAVEDYIASEAIGTGSSFWDKPIQNFLRPAFDMSKHRLGITSIPENVEERRNLNEYFDMLQWTKMSRLEIKSRQEGNNSLAAGFKHKRESTVFGTDVFDSPVNIMKALPRRERDYFGQFLGAKSEEERSQILELIPENEKRIYLSQWLRQSESAAYAKRQAKIDTEEDNDNISIAAHMRTGEGFSYGDAEKEQWLRETEGKIEFDEWLREQKAEEYFSSHSLPGADWIGWNPAVDLDDIKLVTVEMAGLDHHDFDLWGKRKMALARKPYINEEVIREMTQASEYQDSWIVAKNSEALAKMYGDHEARIEQSRIGADLGGPGYNIQVLDGREKTVEKAYKLIGA